MHKYGVVSDVIAKEAQLNAQEEAPAAIKDKPIVVCKPALDEADDDTALLYDDEYDDTYDDLAVEGVLEPALEDVGHVMRLTALNSDPYVS